MRRAEMLNRQSEAVECGLACLAMAANLLGSNIDLLWLRQRYPVSARGSRLRDLVEIAGAIGLSTRAVRCEPEELRDLKTPAILHWGLNHFVVLMKIGRRGVETFDPARGIRTVSAKEVSSHFTGVAMELASTETFQAKVETTPLKITQLFQWTPAVTAAILQTLVLSVLLQLYFIASPLYMQMAVDEAVTKGDGDLLKGLAVGFALFVFFNFGADAFRGVILQRLTSILSWDMTQRLFHHLIRLPLPWFGKRRLADVQSRFQAIDPVKGLISSGLVGAVIDGALSIVTATMMMIFSPSLAAITLVSIVLYLVVRLGSIPITRRYSTDALVASVAEQGKRLETLRAIHTIKMMGGEARSEADWANKFAQSIRMSQNSGLVALSFSTVQKLIDALAYVLIVYIGISHVLAGEMSVGILYAFMAYRAQFSGRAVSFIDQLVSWRLLDIHTHRLADILLAKVEPDVDRATSDMSHVEGRLQLDSVSFRYSPADPLVLENIDLSVEPGEFIAITGPSGVGKSTLLKVLCGLYPATEGEVRLDGRALDYWGAKSVRQILGVVMQDDDLLPGSIAENVAFFDDEIDMAKVWECLRMAAFDEDVRAMPMRADTFVGDMGMTLSGGQRQRILLARALYKEPRILILDEATSHLDLGHERSINAALMKLSITRVIVAHRPETISVADRIFHLSDRLSEVEKRPAKPQDDALSA